MLPADQARQVARKRQEAVVVAVVRGVQANGYAPTTRELAALAECSHAGAVWIVQRCIRRGYLERMGPAGQNAHARNIRPTAAGLRLAADLGVGYTPGRFLPEQRCHGHGLSYFGDRCPECRRGEQ